MSGDERAAPASSNSPDSPAESRSRVPRRGPAQPKRARWRETVANSESLEYDDQRGGPDVPDDGDASPHGGFGDDDLGTESRRHGPAPSRRPGASQDYQVVTDDESDVVPPPPAGSILSRPSVLGGALLTAGALLILLVTLFVFAQAVTFYNEIAALPGWLRPIAYGVLGLLSLGILYFGGRVVWLYVRFRVSPRLSLAADDLESRDRVRRELRDQRLSDARATLTGFLTEYPAGGRGHVALSRLGASNEVLTSLESLRHTLIGRHAISDDAQWLQRFRDEFLPPLDQLAQRHTRTLIKQVFVGTSMAPRGAIDTMIVLLLCYRLVGDLCVIYNVRAGKLETVIIVGHIMVNLFTASQADELGEEFGSQAGELLNVSFDAIPGILSGIAAEFVGRSAEGGVNAFLLWRLSARTQEYLRPIRKGPLPCSTQ